MTTACRSIYSTPYPPKEIQHLGGLEQWGWQYVGAGRYSGVSNLFRPVPFGHCLALPPVAIPHFDTCSHQEFRPNGVVGRPELIGDLRQGQA